MVAEERDGTTLSALFSLSRQEHLFILSRDPRPCQRERFPIRRLAVALLVESGRACLCLGGPSAIVS